MTLHTTAAHLRAATRMFSGIVERHATIPVLSMVLVSGNRMVATNLDTEVQVVIPATGSPELNSAIDWRRLTRLAAVLEAEEDVSITDEDGLATVRVEDDEFRIPSLPAGDFPSFSEIVGPETAVGNVNLSDLIRRVLFAVSTEETRYYLNGIAIVQPEAGDPLICATDGHRLAMIKLPFAIEGAAGRIIPRPVAKWMASRNLEPARIAFSSEKPLMRVTYDGGLIVSTKLIDGNYPDIFRVIPTDPAAVFTVDRLAMLKALRRLMAVSAPSGVGCVKLERADQGLTLSMTQAEARAKVTLAAEIGSAPAEPWETGFNPFYLCDALSVFRGDAVTFASDGMSASGPMLLTCENDPLQIVQMPMQV